MCDTFVALGSATHDGKPIFGKNSDRPYDEVQNIVYFPPKKHKDDIVNCTYIEIPQVKETNGVLLCQPHWMWGAEMGSNEWGVVIGNEAVWTEEPIKSTGLLGMDLLRLGLERSKTSKEALDIIIDLLETHGQGGACSYEGGMEYHNSFLITDTKEAWLLETADKWWVAERVTDGVRNISNDLSIRKKYDLIREGTIEHVIERGYCKNEKDFNFANCFSQGGVSDVVSPFSREGRCHFLLEKNKKKMNVEQAMHILRDHEGGICMHGGFRSTASLVTKINEDGSNVNWITGTPEPCTSIFKPIFLPNPELANNLESTLVPENDKLWWAHTHFFQKASKEDLEKLMQLEKDFINGWKRMESMPQNFSEKFNEYSLMTFKMEFDFYKK